MCGFFVEYRKKNIAFDKNFFLLNASKIKHRGPDDQGEVFLQNFSAKFFRLSILDLSRKANQPMKSRSGRFLILFNGEIYNFLELKKKYNINTQTNSDTEVILHLFEKFGPEMVKMLDGMFSIIIYDQTKNICHFFRDRLGIKPLYYLESNEKIIFSSEIKPLLNYSDKKINSKKVLDFFLKQSMDDDNQTFFKNIKSIEPSTCGKVTSNKISINKYWNFKKQKRFLTLKEEKENIEHLFSLSVKKHLISDRKIGFFFSGGTDSLSILSKTKSYIKNPKLFTYNFLSNDGNFYGEYEKAKEISEDLNLKIDITTVTPKTIIDNFSKVVEVCESPITSIRQICDFLLFKRFKSLNIPVAIIGHGGDELLGGYDYNFLNFLVDKYKKALNSNKFINDLINYIDFKNNNKMDKKSLLLNHIITLTYQQGSTKDCTPFIEINNFSKEFLNDYLNDDKYYFEKKNKHFNKLQNSQMIDIEHVSLPRNLKYCDRLSMSNGIEARVPFLDHKLANYLFNLDNKYKFKNNQTRWIFKSLFKKEISRYFSKKKVSVPDPQALWLRNDLKEFFMDEFISKSFRNNNFFDQKTILKSLNQFHKNKTASSFHLFQIFSFQKFVKQFSV